MNFRKAFLFSALAILGACEKYEEIDIPQQDENKVVTEFVLPEVLSVYVSKDNQDPKTRTYLDGKTVLWHEDDEISYFTGNMHANYVSQGSGNSSVEFTKGDNVDENTEYRVDGTIGIYPYNEDDQIGMLYEDKYVSTVFPWIQTYAPDSFGKGANVMFAKSETAGAEDLYFRNLCGYLVIKLYGEDTAVKSIVLSSRSGLDMISGPARVSTDFDGTNELNITKLQMELHVIIYYIIIIH